MSVAKPPISAPPARARFVVTLPMRPNVLEPALLKVCPEGASALTATQEAFTHLARRSKQRLVLITPFIDLAGIEWATTLFKASPAPERILILRETRRLDDFGSAAVELKSLVTELLEYRVVHASGDRALPIETFHAKIALADGSAAYVGSANMLQSSLEVALECGFFIEGPAVAQVSDLVSAILLVTRSPIES
ncbi:MAG: phospholipase D-like domain-containing protein [Hyphomicrobium sp.]